MCNVICSEAEAGTRGTFNNGKNRYLYADSFNNIGPQATKNTPKNIHFNHRRIFNSGMKLKLSKT